MQDSVTKIRMDKELIIMMMTINKQEGEQDGRVVSTPAFGSEGPRFDPRQQPLVQQL